MTWRQTDDKPLPEPMLIQFSDAYMQHYGEMSQLILLRQLSHDWFW